MARLHGHSHATKRRTIAAKAEHLTIMPLNDQALALIPGGGQGTRLFPLTRPRIGCRMSAHFVATEVFKCHVYVQ